MKKTFAKPRKVAQTWICPVWQEKIDIGCNRSVVRKHLCKRHRATWRQDTEANKALVGTAKSSLGLPNLRKPIDFIHMPEEERVQKARSVCPYCDKCLPCTEPAERQNRTAFKIAKCSKKCHLAH